MNFSLLGVAAVTVMATVAIGCSAEPANQNQDGDVGDDEVTQEEQALTAACKRSEILASVSDGRRTAIERGLEWLDDDVQYSQSRWHNGYRTDCSGFISMCWGLDESYTTASFKAGTAENEILSSYSQLVPGDALVYRSGGHGHIVMFLGWADQSHSNMCVIEQRSTALDMQLHTRNVSSMKNTGYRPIRADKF